MEIVDCYLVRYYSVKIKNGEVVKQYRRFGFRVWYNEGDELPITDSSTVDKLEGVFEEARANKPHGCPHSGG